MIKDYLYSVACNQNVMKDMFQDYIKDQSEPLEERWTAFVEAPESLKNCDSCGGHFNSLPDDFIMYEGPIHAERYQTIYVQDIVERIQEFKKYQGTYHTRHRGLFDKVDLDAFKEECLKDNWGSFVYDW